MFDKNGIDRAGFKRTNGTVEVFLDMYNIESQLEYARSICEDYGDDRVPCFCGIPWVGDDVTGKQFLETVEKMADIARRIITGDVLPNLFDVLPLKKDGTFKAFKNGQTILIYNCIAPGTQNINPCPWETRFVLALVTHSNYQPRKEERADIQHAALIIIEQKGISNKRPLLDENLQVQDIKTRSTYLTEKDILPGTVYTSTDGRQYLFLGSYETKSKYPFVTSHGTYYRSTEWTPMVENIASGCADIDELVRKLENKNVWVPSYIRPYRVMKKEKYALSK